MVPQRFAIVQSTARVLIVAMVCAYGIPSRAQTASSQNTNAPAGNSGQGTSSTAQTAQSSPQPSPAGSATQSNSTPAPSTQQPVTSYPNGAAAAQPDAPQPKDQKSNVQSEPQGAATAEKVSTAGGAAAKPAGVAIAPAKQHQTRSLLIKVGAALAAGAAAGTVYALSRGTSSTPPGSTGPGVVQKK